MIFELSSISLLSWLSIGAVIVVALMGIRQTVIQTQSDALPHASLHIVVVSVLYFIATAALVWLLLQPKILSTNSRSALLITAGASLDEINNDTQDHLLIFDHGQQPFLTETAINIAAEAEFDHAITLSSLQQLPDLAPDVERIVVVGHGLSNQQWRQLPANIKIENDTIYETGLVELQWQKQLILGATLRVSGKLVVSRRGTNQPKDDYLIRLIDPAGAVVDEMPLTDGHFSLRDQPHNLGAFLYRLELHNSDGLVQTNQIDVYIQSSRPQTIAMFLSAPSFEMRSLKNWLGEYNNRVYMDISIGRGLTLSKAINSDENALPNFSPNFLSQLDILIMDSRRIRALEPDQLSALTDAVKGGLGVLLLADHGLIGSDLSMSLGPLYRGLTLTSLTEKREQRVPIWDNVQPESLLSVVEAKMSLLDSQLVVWDEQQHPLVLTQQFGIGTAAVTLVKNTNVWQTQGEQDLFGRYWRHVLSSLTRAHSDTLFEPLANNQHAVEMTKFPLCIRAIEAGRVFVSLTKSGPFSHASDSIFSSHLTAANGQDLTRLCTDLIVPEAGWHKIWLRKLEQENSGEQLGQADASDRESLDSMWLYVHPKSDWQITTAWRLAQATQREAQKHHSLMGETRVQMPRREAMPVHWPLVIFVSAALLLWITNKFRRLR